MRDDGPELPQQYRDLWVSLGAALQHQSSDLAVRAVSAKSYEDLCEVRGRVRAIEQVLHTMSQLEQTVGVNPRGEDRPQAEEGEETYDG